MTLPADYEDQSLPAKGAHVVARNMGGTPARIMPVSEDAKTTTIASLADVTSNGTPSALGSLPAGPSGILLRAHPGNGAVVIRISGADVSATQGQPLEAGASVVLAIDDASRVHHCTEDGSSATLCVSAV